MRIAKTNALDNSNAFRLTKRFRQSKRSSEFKRLKLPIKMRVFVSFQIGRLDKYEPFFICIYTKRYDLTELWGNNDRDCNRNSISFCMVP